METKLRVVLSITILFLSFYSAAQSNYWEPVSNGGAVPQNYLVGSDAEKIKIFDLNEEALGKELQEASSSTPFSKVVYFPDSEGEMHAFRIKETPVFSPELSRKYPNIKSYTGTGIKNNSLKIRFSWSHKGLQSMLVDEELSSNSFLQKITTTGQRYMVYNRKDLEEEGKDFVCATEAAIEGFLITRPALVDDQVLRKFRIAVSATGEYTLFHGGTVSDALAAINATLTRVNQVFETDLGVSLELVGNNDLVIFTDPDTDPYGGNLNSEVQNTLTSTIGELNYDVGHLFHEDNNGGNAGFIGSVCQDNEKGSAYSAALNPQGDLFDIDYVAHELGHQFGANHTWSFESEGTQVQMEPASGTTIMGYAGIVQANNVAPNSDDYFHYISIFQIIQYLQGVSCAQETPLTNSPPIIDPIENFTIPKSTAFVLSGNASDPDLTDVLSYTWEQIDDGVVTNETFGPNNPSGANFRSLKPTTTADRYFPKLSEILQGKLTQSNPTINSAWETVSDIEREMNFAFTVRDNAIGGGQVSSELVKVNVVNSAGPFAVSSQNTGETYTAGTVQTVTWDVAGTDQPPVNAQFVDIFLSLDGGNNFTTMLAEDVPNDGEHQILLPGAVASQARIMVKASNNIFFAVNSTDFIIEESEIVLALPTLEYDVCQPNDLIVPFNYETYSGFSEEVSFSVPDAPAGIGVVFTPATATADTPVTVTFSNTSSIPVGNYPITLTATSLSTTKTVVIQMNTFNTSFPEVTLSAPADGVLDVSIMPSLQWEEDVIFSAYDIEIATDLAFTNVVESASVVFNQYMPTSLLQNTQYFWRVKPKNSCGEGTFSSPFNFTTIQVDCKTRSADGLPLSISSIGTPTVTSTITFINDLAVADVNVSLNLDHSFLSDLIVKVISPQGTEVILVANSCGESQNIDAVFDDDAIPFSCGSLPAISGNVKPLGSLASFNGESTLGDWTLEVFDTAPADGGLINDFSLEICVEGTYRPDDDDDGVFDDGDDLCLGTPKGTEVNTDGCPVYRFPSDNFTLSIDSESCRGNDDGSIAITAQQSLDYTVDVSGNGVNVNDSFTDTYSLGNLAAGTYDICISGTDGTNNFEPFCFEAIVTEPEPLNVSARQSENGQELILELSGSELYNIELNGILTQVAENRVSLNLKGGENTLRVFTNLPCQGTFEGSFFRADRTLVYPNPTQDEVVILLVEAISNPMISIFDLQGRLVNRQYSQSSSAEVRVDLSALQAGIYFVQLEGSGLKKTFKVIKR